MNPDKVADMKCASTTAATCRGDKAARRHRGCPAAALALLTLQVGAFVALTSGFSVEAVRAETISSALSRAYMGNPDLNQQRAATRATDENVSKANGGYRPQVAGTAQFGYARTDGTIFSQTIHSNTSPNSAGFTVTENLFNGNRTTNGVKQAESQVFQSREQTRNTEQNTLQNGATAYMNVLRDTAILELNKNNITVLEEQLRQTRDRFNVGEVTRTDVAQAESSLATARSQYFTAQANLATSIANYRQIIGVEPHRLEAARPIDRLLPPNLNQARSWSRSRSTLASRRRSTMSMWRRCRSRSPRARSIRRSTSSPACSSPMRSRALDLREVPGQRARPVLGAALPGRPNTRRSARPRSCSSQARLQADLQRDMVRANVVSSWGQLESSKAVIRSSRRR